MESLYTKYRPQTFEQVVGQKHVVETLMRAVSEGRTSHAYLFCGPRGTGKTTMARLLAKALLCEKGPGEMPDGTCEQCRLIAAGEHPDVAELDAASRTGVDNVRDEIISRVNYAPTMGRCKVYIIDEVHMLTAAAFNALLKTLEEPPEHVVFIMCTTDPQKILPTILSRVQRFDFHAIAPDEMQAHLAYVCGREGFTFDDAALELVVRHARGGMRDALTSLEQLSVFGNGNISLKAAQDFLGEVSGSVLSVIGLALAQREVPTLYAEVEKLVGSGRDLLQFTRELASHIRDIYVLRAAPNVPGVVSATGEDLEALKTEAAAFGSTDRVARVLTILGEASSEMRTATNQRLVLEIAFTRIARPDSDLTLESLADRIAILEQKIASGNIAVPAPAATAPAASVATAPTIQDAASVPAVSHSSTSVPTTQPNAAVAPSSSVAQSPARQVAQAVAAPASPAPSRQQTRPVAQAASPRQAAPAQGGAATAPAASGVDGATLQRVWKGVVDSVVAQNRAKGSLLLSTYPVSDDGETLTIGLPAGSGFAAKMLERTDVRAVIEPVVNGAFGGHRILVFAESGSGAVQAAPVRGTAQAAPAAAARPTAPTYAAPAPAAQPAPQRAAQPTAQSAPKAAPAPQPVPAAVPAPTAAVPEAAPVSPEPDYAPVDAYADAAPASDDYAMPWDEAPASQAPAQSPAGSAPEQQLQNASSEPVADSSAPASGTTVVEGELTPEFQDILAGLTAVFGAPSNVSVESAAAAEPEPDVPYDEGSDDAEAQSEDGFTDEPSDDEDSAE